MAEDNETAREREIRAGKRLWLGNQAYVLGGAVALYVAGLLLPVVTGVRGFDVVAQTAAARDANIKLTEYVFAYLALVGVGVFTPLTLIFRRAALAMIAWVATAIGTFYAVLAFWLRQQRPGGEEQYSISGGFLLIVVAVVVCLVTYSMVTLRRSDDQRELARERAAAAASPDSEYEKRAAAVFRRGGGEGENPLLVDDRRARARARHGRGGEARSTAEGERPAGGDERRGDADRKSDEA